MKQQHQITKVVHGKLSKRLKKGTQPNQRRRGNPTWTKGHAKFGGRQAGTPNVIPNELKELIIEAYTEYGADGQGKEGLKGFLKLIADEHISTAAMLLRAVLPLQVKMDLKRHVVYETLEELRAAIVAKGLPASLTREIFRIEYNHELAKEIEELEGKAARGEVIEEGGTLSDGRKRDEL